MWTCPSCDSDKAKKLVATEGKLKCDQCHKVENRDLNLIFRRNDTANKGRFSK